MGEGKLTLLGNGIDLGRFDRDSISAAEAQAARADLGAHASTDVVVGVVGRLVREKGLQEVFEAARLIRRDIPAIRFVVIGPEEPQKSASLTYGDRACAAAAGVRFLGEREDVVRLYRGMDVFVQASHREGFPRSAMEAAAMGLPIVATDIRGCRQVVDDGITGLLVPPRDPAALADAVVALAVDPDRRAEMSAAGRRKARQHFDQQRCIDITLRTYRSLLDRASEPSSEGRLRTNAHMSQPRREDLRLAEPADVAVVATLHRAGLPNGFLPTLGARPLEYLYGHIVRSPEAFVLVAEDEGGVSGFAAVAADTQSLYRNFLRRRGVAAALVAAPAVLRAPRQVWETVRYGTRPDTTGLPSAEILAVVVAERARGTGVAQSLLAVALEELRVRGIPAARVVTATGNTSALRLYEHAGFRRERQTEVHRGVPQQVLVWP
jgi:ribosomal protein S18 acetylase RimI-like enzyme